MIKPYICPKCGTKLSIMPEGYNCPGCGNSYHCKEGIDSFCGKNSFYEEKFIMTEPDSIKPLAGLYKAMFLLYRKISQSHHRNIFIEDAIKSKSNNKNVSILDLGCGGGSRFIASLGQVCGMDLSLEALKNAVSVYESVLQADILSNPLEENTFDYVVCKDVFGHIPYGDKDKFCAEVFRILKPGGRVILAIELDPNNWVIREAKKHPILYEKHFIQKDGHVGLEDTAATCRRFVVAGFEIRKRKALYKTGITRAEQYLASFDNEYQYRSPLLRSIVRVAKIIDGKTLLRGPYAFLAGLMDGFLGEWLPDDHAQLLLLCCEKPKGQEPLPAK